MEDCCLTLTSVHYELLLQRKTAIESTFDVIISTPRKQNSGDHSSGFFETFCNQSVTVNENAIFLVSFAGEIRNVVASKKYVMEALVHPEIVEIHQYHKDLKNIFCCGFWKSVIERIHNVCISDGSDNELNIAGKESSVSHAALCLQKLSDMYCSNVACPTLDKASTYQLNDVLKNLKIDSDFSFLFNFSDNVNGLLLSWLKDAYLDHFLKYNEPENLNNSVILDYPVPSSEIPIITIDSDDDDDENCYKQDRKKMLISRKKNLQRKQKRKKKADLWRKKLQKKSISNSINMSGKAWETASALTTVQVQLEKKEIQDSLSPMNFPDFIPLHTKKNAVTSSSPLKLNVKTKKKKLQSLPALPECTPLKIEAEGGLSNIPSSRTTAYLVSETVRKLRPIVIDGSNVAMAHGGNKAFSWRGISLCIEYFEKRGHTNVTALVPQSRRHYYVHGIIDKAILDDLIEKNRMVFTPSRKGVDGRRITCYDDRFIVDLANRIGGVIVSNDAFLDLVNENSEWREVIKERVLMFCFAGDIMMFPDDPLGVEGPHLSDFLSFPDE